MSPMKFQPYAFSGYALAAQALTKMLGSRRLWITKESRERWLAVLETATRPSTVGVAIVAFKQHCKASLDTVSSIVQYMFTVRHP